jgi:hypothetical protein
VTGQTSSADFPTTAGAFNTAGGASALAFVTLVDTNALPSAPAVYSTFLGGNGGDEGLGIRVDGQGNAYVAGKTQSSDFPHSQGALQPAMAAGASGSGFVFEVSPSGKGQKDLLYSSYLGGSGDGIPSDIDQAEAIALDSSNNVYITGHTYSSASSFYVLNPIPTGGSLNPPSDAFVTKLTLIPTMAVSPTNLDFGIQPVGVTSTSQTVTLTNNTSDPILFPGTSIAFSGSNPADFASPSNTCGASIAAAASCTVGVTFTPSGPSGESATLAITVTITNGGVSGAQTFNVSLTGTGSISAPGVGLAPPTLAFGGQLLTTTSAAKP